MILSGTRPANHHRLPAAGDCADQPRNRVFERHRNAFEDIVLDAGQRAEALRLFDRVFDAMVAFVDACHEYALAYAGPGVLPRPGRDPGWAQEWETLPWSASQTIEFCYLNPDMDPARYQLS